MKLSISFMPSDIPQLPEHYHFRVPPSIGDKPRTARRAFSIIQGQADQHNGGLAETAGTSPGPDAIPDRENRTKRTYPQAKGTPRTKRTVRTKKTLRTGVPLAYAVFRIRDPGLQSPARRSFRCRSWLWLRREGPSARRGPGFPAPARGRRRGPARSSRSVR